MGIKGTALFDEIIAKCDQTLEDALALGMAPNDHKKLLRRFNITEAESMVGRSRTTIYSAIKKLELEEGNRGLSLDQINTLREHFGTLPHRKPGQKCIKVAVQSFKGGVSKSVTAVHLSQWLAIRGYRVLVVDFDPQASATSSFGYVPDNTFTEEHTIGPFLEGKTDDLRTQIISTYFPGIDLLPSCLPLYQVEFGIFFQVADADTAEERRDYYFQFKEALESVEENYDVIVMDSPPALSMVSINILVAADGIIVPTPPSLYDFSSTRQFFEMARKVITDIAQDYDKEYQFIKVMPAKVEKGKGKQMEFLEVMRDNFGSKLMNSFFASTSAIPNAASYFQTVYDTKQKDKRVYPMLDAVFEEIEVELKKCWVAENETVNAEAEVA